MSKQIIRLSKREVRDLTNNKPVVYIIMSNNGTNIYTGVARKSKLSEELMSHFYGQPNHVPGARVSITEFPTLKEAQEKGAEIVDQERPHYNLAK